MSFVEFVEGPLWYFTAVVFVAGVLWRLIGILRLPRARDLSVPRTSAMWGAVLANLRHLVPRGTFFSRTKFNVIAGYMFHLGLFVLLFFAAPHVKFLEERVLGFGWTPLPNWAFIVAAEFAFAGLLLLWLRRLLDPVLRKLSDADDHWGAGLTFLAMLTGCMALLQQSEALRIIHLLFVEAWLLYFPFSRLMHTFTFVFSRSYTGELYGRRGEVL